MIGGFEDLNRKGAKGRKGFFFMQRRKGDAKAG